MAKPQRRWMPVDVAFTRDDKVLEAGWPAAELYLAGLGHLTTTASFDGKISRQTVSKLGVSRWDHMANRLVKAGLWDEIDPDTYRVSAWLAWQQESESAARTREYRQRLASRDRSQGDVT